MLVLRHHARHFRFFETQFFLRGVRHVGPQALGVDRDTQRIPVIYPRGGASDTSFAEVQIVGGNTLADGSPGIKYVDAGVAAVPSAYDPSVTTSFIDGIGRGVLFIDGVPQAGYVLVVADNRSSIHYALKGGVSANGEYVATPTTVSIPVTGTMPVQHVTCYVPVWV